MDTYQFQLFRDFSAEVNGKPLEGLESRKVQELLSYLLISHERPYTRERLAALLWPESPADKAKKYLRQTLWQMQSALDQPRDLTLLEVDHDWISAHTGRYCHVDVADFEATYEATQATEGRDLSAEQTECLTCAVALYRGDLLETWYEDWCVFERERLQNMYMAMLDKLVGRAEATRDLEMGFHYAMLLLRLDAAHERTYRRLMRLHYFAGDRTGALRQFQRCQCLLRQELDVAPSQRTVALRQQIEEETLPLVAPPLDMAGDALDAELCAMLAGLRQLNQNFEHSYRQMQDQISTLQNAFTKYVS